MQAGYTVGYHKFTNIFNSNLESQQLRTQSTSTPILTNNIFAESSGINVPNNVPLNYGVPNIQSERINRTFGASLSRAFRLSQTISFSEVLSWIHGKHNLRFGGDYRRVHRDFWPARTRPATSTFTEGLPRSRAGSGTGSPWPIFCWACRNRPALNSSLEKSYLRDNVWTHTHRTIGGPASLTLNYGMRYEFFAPYSEKYGHLADVVTNPTGGSPPRPRCRRGPRAFRGRWLSMAQGIRPSLGLAWRVPKLKQTVVRAGFGMNYTVGEYSLLRRRWRTSRRLPTSKRTRRPAATALRRPVRGRCR